MKNTMKYMLLAIAAIALGVSCQREDLLQPEGGLFLLFFDGKQAITRPRHSSKTSPRVDYSVV